MHRLTRVRTNRSRGGEADNSQAREIRNTLIDTLIEFDGLSAPRLGDAGVKRAKVAHAGKLTFVAATSLRNGHANHEDRPLLLIRRIDAVVPAIIRQLYQQRYQQTVQVSNKSSRQESSRAYLRLHRHPTPLHSIFSVTQLWPPCARNQSRSEWCVAAHVKGEGHDHVCNTQETAHTRQ